MRLRFGVAPRDVFVTSYFLRRLLLIIPTFIGVSLLVFTLTRLVPGGPIERMLNEAAMAAQPGMSIGSNAAAGAGARCRKNSFRNSRRITASTSQSSSATSNGWAKVVRFDLGTSTRYSEPVWDIIKSRFPISIFYGVVTLILTYGVCIPLGIVKAIRHKACVRQRNFGVHVRGLRNSELRARHRAADGVCLQVELVSPRWIRQRRLSMICQRQEQLQDVFKHAVLPVLSYMAGSFAVTTMMMKNALMDNLAADYVRTAIAKGMTFRRAVFRHALRNSLVPIATSFGK